MELFALLLSLVLGVLQVGLSALLPPFLGGQFYNKLLVLLLSYTQGLASFNMKVGLNPSLALGIFHTLLGHKYHGLCKNDRGIHYQIRRR